MLIATAAVGLVAGCGGDDNVRSTSTTAGGTDSVSQPVGNVVGNIQSTNGEPIEGATVSVGSRSATTGPGGDFEITDVPVTNTVGTVTNPGAVGNQFVPVSVVPPEGGDVTYAGATATVNPQAQIFNDTPIVSAPSGATTTFVDGYTASVGTIRLPALTTRVTGTLLSSATGLGVPNTSVTLDFADIAVDNDANDGDGNLTPADGTEVSYSVPLVSTQTDADGNFEFLSVADDACFVFRASNFTMPVLVNGQAGIGGCDVPADGNPIGARGVLISTVPETDMTVNLSQINVTPLVNQDAIGPYVVNVSGVPVQNTGATPGNAGNRGVLSNGIDGTGGITIRLSEPVAASLTDSDLVVVTGMAPNQTALPSDLTVNSPTEIVVTTQNPIPPGTPFTIYIRAQSLIDGSGNPPMNDPPTFTLGNPVPANNPTFDAAPAPFNGNPQLAVFLNTFQPTNQTANAVMLDQVNAEETAGSPPGQALAPSSSFPFQTTSALLDTVNDGNLNNASNLAGAAVTPTTPVGQPTQILFSGNQRQNMNEPQLPNPNEDLFTNIVDNALFAGLVNRTEGQVLRTTVTLPSNNPPVDVLVSVMRNNTVLDTRVFPVQNQNGSALNNGPVQPQPAAPMTDPRYVINPNGLTTFDLVVTGAPGIRLQPGDVLMVTSRAGGGLLGATASLTIGDNAPPTTTPQLLAQQINTTLQVALGTGGGVVQTGTGDRHLFVFPVSPQALDSVDNQPNYTGDNLRGELASSNINQGNELDGERGPALAGLGNPVISAESVFHDATSTDAFANAPMRRLGISVTEPLAAPPLVGMPGYNGNAALSNFDSQNNVANEGNPLPAPNTNHLVIFDVDDIGLLEADGRDTGTPRIVDLTDSIEDVNGVTADDAANARVLVRDFKPPVMTRGFYDGQQLVFRFDEAIRLQGNLTFLDCAGGAQTLSLTAAANAPSDQATLSMSNTQVTIPVTNGAVPAGIASCFDNGMSNLDYAENAYTAANLAGQTMLPAAAIDDTPAHGAVIYDTVPDRAMGTVLGTSFPDNTWAAWNANNLGTETPVFAWANIVGPFAINQVARGNQYQPGATADAPAGSVVDDFSVDLRFSQPVFVTDSTPANDGAAGDRDDAAGDDADEAPYGNDDGVVTPAEALAWATAKFAYVSAGVDGTNNSVDGNGGVIPVAGDDLQVAPTGVQIIDADGNDITTVGSNDQQAVRIVLTIPVPSNPAAGGPNNGDTMTDPGEAVQATDDIRILSGQQLSAQFDTMNNTNVFPFDQSNQVPAVPGDAINQVEENRPVPPVGTNYVCPQTMSPGGANEC